MTPSLRRLALLVVAILAGTALTVGSYVESRALTRPAPWVRAACSLRSARLVVPEATPLPCAPPAAACPLSSGECDPRPVVLERRCQPG